MTENTLLPEVNSPLLLYPDDYSAQEIARLSQSLPSWRRDQAERFRHDSGRRQCVLAYEALCHELREKYGIDDKPDFDYNAHGKPRLARYPAIHFSLSHCRQAVGCLIADSPCGLDIEAPRKVKESLIRYTMNEAEVEWILGEADTEMAFLKLWTRKEAVLKLHGTGIIDNMKNALAPDLLRGIELHTSEDSERGLVCSWATMCKKNNQTEQE